MATVVLGGPQDVAYDAGRQHRHHLYGSAGGAGGADTRQPPNRLLWLDVFPGNGDLMVIHWDLMVI